MTHTYDDHEDSSTLRRLMLQWQGGGNNQITKYSPRDAVLFSDMLRRLPIVSGSERWGQCTRF